MNVFSRRDFVRGATAIAAAPFVADAAKLQKRPNILMIMADQLSADVLQDKSTRRYLHVPNLDRLASKSVSFTRAYAATPLCVPARTAIFTGAYPIETGVETNDRVPFDEKRFPCVARFVREAGYETAYFGKWHLPYRVSDKETHGFELIDAKGNPDDSRTATQATEYLHGDHAQPFFCVVSFLEPHNICEWARGEALDQGSVGKPPSSEDELPPLRANHAPQKGEPDAVTLARESYQAARMFPVGNFTDRKWREYEWAYYRMIEILDRRIGLVLDALDKKGLADDTAILFVADHGDCQGAHMWNQKTVFYDESSRVPLFLSYPKHLRAGSSDMLINTGLDLFPTICRYAGAEQPSHLEGKSLTSLSRRSGAQTKKDFVVVTNHLVQGVAIDGVKPQPRGRMLRTDRYKYVVYDIGKVRESLVDMIEDPGEEVNLAGSARMRSVLEEHRRILNAWGAARGDAFPYIHSHHGITSGSRPVI